MFKKLIPVPSQILKYASIQDALKTPKYLKKPKGTNEENSVQL